MNISFFSNCKILFQMTTLEFHQSQLKKVCRICGDYSGQKNDKYKHKLDKEELIEKLLYTFGVDVNGNSLDVHPTNCCNCCYSKCIKAEKDTLYKTHTIPVLWEKHGEDNCKTCERFRLKTSGGRKRKKTGGRGRPANAKKRKDNENHPTRKICNSIIPPPLITPMPEIHRFVNPPPHDLLCPICKEVLDQPIQSACEHNFCLKCAQAWLAHSGHFTKCPVCSIRISHFTKASRLLSNIISSLLVACAKCKCPFALDRLKHHQSECT